MNNILFDIRGDKRNLEAALAYLETINKPKCYAIVPKKGLILFWHKEAEKVNLEFPPIGDPDWKPNESFKALVELKNFDIPWKDFIKSWVMSVNPNDFELDTWEKDPDDEDVSTDNGFRMSCSTWGHVGGSHYAYALIKPIFAWYGR